MLGEAGELGKRARESVQRATPQPHILGRRAEPQLLHLKVS
ncbi:Uncharacterised protein [Bordetella pertussis]|nr:Uncharacterised protein [Bordetella pertussis]